MLTGMHSVLPLGACQLLISDVPVNLHHPCLPILAMLFAEDLYLGHQWLSFQFGCFYAFMRMCLCSALPLSVNTLLRRCLQKVSVAGGFFRDWFCIFVLLGFVAFFFFLRMSICTVKVTSVFLTD